jgi:metallo-beta-lactamase class B
MGGSRALQAWLLGALVLGGAARAGTPAPGAPDPDWTARQRPFLIYGNTYYVGTRGLSAILITSAAGHVLIDGTVPEGAPQVAENIRALGFKVGDIRLILNSHVHFDHAGGLAALQKLSGAAVAASPSSARALLQGHSGPDDPQYASLARSPDPLAHVRVIQDGETLAVGALRVTAHFTPGHTPGGTSWSWESCAHERCLHIVYADSLSAVSAPGFRFSHSADYPQVLDDFRKSFAVLAALPCDILLTPHPDASDMLGRLARRDSGADPGAFINAKACGEYAAAGRTNLTRRLASEAQAPQDAPGAAR